MVIIFAFLFFVLVGRAGPGTARPAARFTRLGNISAAYMQTITASLKITFQNNQRRGEGAKEKRCDWEKRSERRKREGGGRKQGIRGEVGGRRESGSIGE